MPKHKKTLTTPCTKGVMTCHVKTERRSHVKRNKPICDFHFDKFFPSIAYNIWGT